ncbi:hypothetical protein HIO71_17130 [Chryseobacterium aquaticum]|uniref:Uncharacterized protein n=1 Tax=Chryseobacterium aquaticum TaxID=452084 RepID=A0A848N8V6_9FLAO|nr:MULTISPECIES: hypothetical protein [Chryseobacterium]NMR35904.1 hypothetical protein [Chryseobacterium aquaticum]NRQ47979.1 hypothetical protein [Chryseobacterium sp. C-204]
MKFKINKLCDEDWESMQNVLEDKFCEKCFKKVLDLTQKNESEIDTIVKKSDEEVCGRILSSHISKIALSTILVLNLTLVSAQTLEPSLRW